VCVHILPNWINCVNIVIQTSPADGKVLYCGEVEHGMLEQVKGVSYSLVGFLGPFETLFPGSDKDVMGMYDFTDYHCLMSNQLNKLYHCIIYLAPGDYHRFHSPADWAVYLRRYFPGQFAMNVLMKDNEWVALFLTQTFGELKLRIRLRCFD